MRITKWGEYGVLCSLYVGLKMKEGSVSVSAAEISDAQMIPLQYAQQVLQRLKKGGIIKTIRGPKGGYLLAETPANISIRDVMLAADGETFELICESRPLNQDFCGHDSVCSLRSVWGELRDKIDSYLSGVTLEDLLQKGVPSNTIVNLQRKSVRQ